MHQKEFSVAEIAEDVEITFAEVEKILAKNNK